MFTWISRLFLILILAGCVAPGGSTAGTGRLAVLGGSAIVAVPSGYCLERSSLHAERGGTVVVGGRCSASGPARAAAITISVGADGSSAVLKSGARALTDWVRSPAGRAALARDGNVASLRVRETLVADGAFLMRLEDRAIGTYWRAAIGLRGRLVMISVTPPDGGELTEKDSRSLVMSVISAMRRANGAQ